MMRGISKAVLFAGGSVATVALLTATPAAAQTTEDSVAELVVTGSRLPSGFLAPTPVQINSAEQLQARAPVLSDALLQLPAFKNSQGPRTQAQSNLRHSGAALLNLRGLSEQRTLVLVNGRRYITFAGTGAVNVDMIPQDIVDRVEVVTGGASAAYGSDAVAGVVNFILDDDLQGGRVSARAGVSEYGDGQMYAAATSFGSKFGDAGHFVVSADYYQQDEIGHPQGRPWADAYWTIIQNGAQRVIAQPNVWANNAPGGLITTGVLSGQQFLPDGTLAPFVNGQYKGSLYMIGGSGVPQEVPLVTGIKRASLFGRASYDVTSDVNVWTELTYAQAIASVHTQHVQIQNAEAFTIFNDNAYLPTAVRAAMAAAGQTSFRLGRYNRDFGLLYNNVRTRAGRATVGVDWKLADGWKLSAYAMHGESRYRNRDSNLPIRRNLYAAADAVVNPANGQIVCRSTLSGLTPGCVPINLFGEGRPSREALNYILGESRADMVFKEDVLSATLSGSPLSLPAGPVLMAAGVEYRREDANQVADPISTTINTAGGIRGFPAIEGVLGGFPFANQVPLVGSYDIREGFLEAEAPLIKDMPLAHALVVNGAVRLTDYSTAGQVTTWKIGVVYEPTADLRLRATRSRDIRAGTVSELFAPVSRATVFVTRNGATVSAGNIRSGNRDLEPEVANTTTLGVIYSPAYAPGLNMSLDLYRINIGNAIATLTPQATIDQCAVGNQVACAQISTDSTGLVVRTAGLNLASLKTHGVDAEIGYAFDLGPGRLTTRLVATHISKLETRVPGSAPIDRAGDITIGATPKWSGNLSVNYRQGPFTLDIQERYIGKGVIDVTLPTTVLPNNGVDAVFYTDISARYRFGRDGRFEVFGSVNNLFGKDPPIAPTALAGVFRSTQAALYDVLGRYVTLGVRATF